MKTTLKVDGMSCKHCSGRVTRLLEKTEGLSDVSVSLEKGEAVFDCGPETDLAGIMDGIRDLGFKVAEK